MPASEAAAFLFAVRRAPEGLARSLLEPLVEEDARLGWRGAFVALADREPPALEEASFVVFDLETTGLAVASSRICEIGAVRVERLETVATFETLVAPGVPLPAPIGRLTGSRTRSCAGRRGSRRRCGASRRSRATRCSSRTTRASTSGS